jgi:hypothetical protein
MLYTILEIISVTCGITGAMLTTSKRAKVRAAGFTIFMCGSVCSILVYQNANLYVMLGQSFVFLTINARGIRNNIKGD